MEVLEIKNFGDEVVDIRFPLPSHIHKRVSKLLKTEGIQLQRDFIVAVAPGVLKSHHRWNMARFAELIEMILNEDHKANILLVGSPSDLKDAKEVLEKIDSGERIVNLVGRTTFSEVLAVLSICKILIACDGGLVYMAAAMECNTISLWGPGVMDRFKPPGENHIGVRKDYSCVPCVNYSRLGEFPPCPYDRKCLNDITAKDVFDFYIRLKSLILRDRIDFNHDGAEYMI
jgi:ADP-heptose:LPS heptosyltransferase